MKHTWLFAALASSSLLLAGCGSSPAEKQIEAQTELIEQEAELTVQKQETVEEYKRCVKNSDGEEDKLRMCEALLKVLDTPATK
ncbi:hypothetical protein [Motilimonas pumila]|uniref:Lipoprotein n=1 Tax=Motilimonas pumila TaxID=2303987 RepID=A0A418Y9W5_9GAMM|nr:hypothetical protein [Motilimonas pumila]RJG38292.1 hypothetical protein D1Z90_19070 [Motilimonas pumila]